MKQLLFGFFAHPDDEAFGPAGFLYQQALKGTELHLVAVTDGEAGECQDEVNLGPLRLKEWGESCRRIGVSGSRALHFPDGKLSNQHYGSICSQLLSFVQDTLMQTERPCTISFLTFAPDGVSGHLDHIAVSHMTTYIYLRLRKNLPHETNLGLLRYYCLPRILRHEPNIDWIFGPAGHNSENIDEVISFSSVAQQRKYIMEAHKSQYHDMQSQLKQREAMSKQTKEACESDHFLHFKY